MTDSSERIVAGLRIRIDRDLCVGFGDCVDEDAAFGLDETGLAVFAEPEQVERARLLAACDACPVDAITVWDETGRQVVP